MKRATDWCVGWIDWGLGFSQPYLTNSLGLGWGIGKFVMFFLHPVIFFICWFLDRITPAFIVYGVKRLGLLAWLYLTMDKPGILAWCIYHWPPSFSSFKTIIGFKQEAQQR